MAGTAMLIRYIHAQRNKQKVCLCPAGAGSPQRDVLGYYALLGLDSGSQGDTSDASIKTAFRQAALREHPDRHEVGLPILGGFVWTWLEPSAG